MRVLLISMVIIICLALPAAADTDDLPEKWQTILSNACRFSAPGARVECLSNNFLGTPYRADTLGGGPGQDEHLTIEFEAVDCFTLLDYIEALRRIEMPGEFRAALINVRYRDGIVTWSSRKHFFTDWALDPEILDVTAEIAPYAVQSVEKELNRHADGTPVLPGIPLRHRRIFYHSADPLNPEVLDRLQPGDYIGIYSEEAWLDVSHVGLLVIKNGKAYLRHASSRPETLYVIDSPLIDYLRGKPGIIVLRPESG